MESVNGWFVWFFFLVFLFLFFSVCLQAKPVKRFALEICHDINGIIKCPKSKFRCSGKKAFCFPGHQEGTPNVHCFLEAHYPVHGNVNLSKWNV